MANSVYHLTNPVMKDDVDLVDTSRAMLYAVAIGAKILDYAKVRSWDDLEGRLPGNLRLTSSQADLVKRYENLCALQRAKDNDLPKVSVCVCSDCSRWMLIATGGTKPTKCTLTPTCSGKILSAPTGVKKTIETPEEIDDLMVLTMKTTLVDNTPPTPKPVEEPFTADQEPPEPEWEPSVPDFAHDPSPVDDMFPVW